jgi:hypothetical protein
MAGGDRRKAGGGARARHWHYLIQDPIRAVLLHEAGVPVLVPAPERYALHKLIVAQRRREGSEKRAKDLAQSAALLNVLARRRSNDLAAAWSEVWSRGKSWRSLLGEGLGLLEPEARDRTLKAVGATRSAIPKLDLVFDAPPVRYDFDRTVLSFLGNVGTKRHRCAVSAETLEDHFGSKGASKEATLEAFRSNRTEIERLSREAFLSLPISDLDETVLRTDDVPALRRKLKRRRDRRIVAPPLTPAPARRYRPRSLPPILRTPRAARGSC